MSQFNGRLRFLVLALALSIAVPVAWAGDDGKSKVDLYGFAMLDMGYQSGQNDPDWFDVVRPTKLPSFENQFGKDGRFFAGVRQSRFGVKAAIPAGDAVVKTIFEFELFGVGADAGQTTFRLRHVWGEWKQIGAGQTWSPFMDPDVFPNSIEYWGPNGMVFFRNVQLRWTPIQGPNTFMVALERPGASGDTGVYSELPALAGVRLRFPLPDVSARFRMSRDWGHLQVAGILRRIEWDDLNGDPIDLAGNTLGWGVNVSTNVRFAEDTLRASVVYGEGIENYMNDAAADVGITNDIDDIGEALPVLGIVLFFDYAWDEALTSTVGYSRVDIDNSPGQSPGAFKTGQYALVNLLYHPAANVMMGPELQWAKRENNSDGWSVDDFRLQFSAKYSFGHTFGGQ